MALAGLTTTDFPLFFHNSRLASATQQPEPQRAATSRRALLQLFALQDGSLAKPYSVWANNTDGRKMSRLRKVFTTPLPDALRKLPGGEYLVALLYLVGFVGLNYALFRSLITGEMLGRYGSGWTEGRESAPILFWIYIGGLGIGTLFIDVVAVLFLRGLKRDDR